jgi:hypothetical protein
VKHRNLLANPQVTFCVVDPKMPMRYIEIRGYAQIGDDPKGTLSRKMFRRLSGKEPDLGLPAPGTADRDQVSCALAAAIWSWKLPSLSAAPRV